MMRRLKKLAYPISKKTPTKRRTLIRSKSARKPVKSLQKSVEKDKKNQMPEKMKKKPFEVSGLTNLTDTTWKNRGKSEKKENTLKKVEPVKMEKYRQDSLRMVNNITDFKENKENEKKQKETEKQRIMETKLGENLFQGNSREKMGQQNLRPVQETSMNKKPIGAEKAQNFGLKREAEKSPAVEDRDTTKKMGNKNAMKTDKRSKRIMKSKSRNRMNRKAVLERIKKEGKMNCPKCNETIALKFSRDIKNFKCKKCEELISITSSSSLTAERNKREVMKKSPQSMLKIPLRKVTKKRSTGTKRAWKRG